MGKFSDYLFRCSALGHLMAEPQGDTPMQKYQKACTNLQALIDNEPPKFNKDGKTESARHKSWVEKCDKQGLLVSELKDKRNDVELSDGAKTHLMDIWISETKRRKADINNKFIEKGLAVEEDGITLRSRLTKTFFKKNETHLSNEFIKGTPDLFIGETIHKAERIDDVKCSWNANTFYRTFTKAFNPLYYWQGVGYMWLSGARKFVLAYCLVNTPEPLIEAEKRQLWYKLGQPSDDDANWVDAQWAIDRNMRYDDIPLREKMLEYELEYNEADVELLKKKIIAARDYLNWLDNEFALKFAA